MNFKNSVILLVMFALISGYATAAPTIETVSDSEAFKYEKEYLAEYESLKKNFSNSSIIKWVQPSNKKELCKLYVGVDPITDRTVDKNYKIFWDGDCKDGYAYGLGREFERGTILNMDALAIYQGTKEEPQYFIQKYNLDNVTQEGDITNGYYVLTTITEDNYDFNIIYDIGYFGTNDKLQPTLLLYSSPFQDFVWYMKHYPNFHYQLIDTSNDEFDQNKNKFTMMNEKGVTNGFEFVTPKLGDVYAGEMVNGNFTRYVTLPESYYDKANEIYDEVAQAAQKAISAQKEALRVKKQYMIKICKDSVQVKFIDNSEYKSICNESENNNLKEKIENKFAQINSQKQQKSEQVNQQKLIDAQVAQTNAAQSQANATARIAAAAEQSNNSQSLQELNNKIHDFAQSMQQTNSYSYPSIKPYSGTTYNSNKRKVKNCYTASGIEFCN